MVRAVVDVACGKVVDGWLDMTRRGGTGSVCTPYGETHVAVHVPLAEPTDVELFMAVP